MTTSDLGTAGKSHSLWFLVMIACSGIMALAGVSFSQDWVLQNSGTTLLLHDIVFVDGMKGWAVGRGGTIIHTTDGGESWTPQVSGTVSILHSVSFVDSLTGWAVGEPVSEISTILHTTDGGNTWTLQSGITGVFYSCHFINHTTGWAVGGGGGAIYHTSDAGTTWTLQRTELNQLLFEIHFLDDSTGYVAGQTSAPPRTAVMLSTSDAGLTWNSLNVGASKGLQSAFFNNYANGWAVGWLGEMIRTSDGGVTWLSQTSGQTDELLFSIFFNTETSGWVVGGESGCQLVNCDSLQGEETIILRTTDAGATWGTFSSPISDQNLTKVYFNSPDTGWIVGAGGTILRTINGTVGSLFLPPAVNLVSPEEDGTVNADSVELRWIQTEPEVDLYWVELGEDSLFAASMIDSTQTDTAMIVRSLLDGNRYWWRVRAHNTSGWGAFSNARIFTVNTPPALPPPTSLVTPANGSERQPTTVILGWMSLVGGDGDSLFYHVQVSEDSLFASVGREDSTLTDTTHQVALLESAIRYYWRVRGMNISGRGTWSDVWNFRTSPAIPATVILISPEEGGVILADSVELHWNRAEPEIDVYWAEYGEDSLFIVSVIDSTRTDTVTTVRSLLDGARYWWRARAHNASGWGAFSPVRSLAVDILPVVPSPPSLISPVDRAIEQPTGVVLAWNPADEVLSSQRAGSIWNEPSSLRSEASLAHRDISTESMEGDSVSFHIQVSEDSAFTVVLVEDSVVIDTIYHIDSLAYSTTYYWRVSASNESGAGDWSEIWSFTTTIGAPAQVLQYSPANGSILIGDRALLSWQTGNPAVDRYWLEFDDDSSFTGSSSDSTLIDSVFMVPNIVHHQTYYWHVRAHNVTGWGPFSEVWSFLALTTAPPAPLLVSPQNASIDQPTALMLTWNAMNLQLIGPPTEENSVDRGPRTHFRANADRLPRKNGLVVGEEQNPSMISNDTTTYHLQLATDSLFVHLVADDSLLVDTTRQVGQLDTGTIHYWRVLASNAAGIGSWSETWTFRTIVGSPEQVSLMSPPNGSTVTTDTLIFLWHQSQPEIDRYWFEHATDSLFTGSMIDSMLTDTTVTLNGLYGNNNYWWRVRARNAAGWGPFNQRWNFMTNLTEVKEVEGIPRDFTLNQNFPNPFNPSTVIRYGLPGNSHVLLEVFNVLGQRVAVLVDADQEAGYHSITLQSGRLAQGPSIRSAYTSGVYFYRILTVDRSSDSGKRFEETKKFVVLR